jgi:NADPH:quinone reductase-like Zn-dependent oxidoreductase
MKGKTFAEYCLYDEKELCKKPKNISFEEAATLSTPALISYRIF